MSKRNISYTKPDDPSFLKKLKSKVGYKDDGPNITTKSEYTPFDESEDREDDEDEKPTVVVLNKDDLSQEEADKIIEGSKDDDAGSDGKVKFRKPVKVKEEKKDSKRQKSESKKVKSSRLLSFEIEDD